MTNQLNNSIIFFDGVCNLCNGFVQFVIRRDKSAKFKFASLQSAAAANMLKPFDFPLDELKTIVLVQDGKIFLRSRAVLRIASQLGGAWKLAAMLYIFPSFFSDAVYNLISKYRYKLFGKKDSCMIPTPELKSRFVE
ncbi:MAG: thiol-disulfide oxidoreductase DCC family protein [Bacteroidetes bacterium]|nr:thiol-disulfide oxidoreductase DCC family protein [Bacteroidota bacterium]